MVACFENEAKCSGSRKRLSTHTFTYAPTNTDRIAAPRGTHAGKVFGCIGELKAEDLKDKKAAVTYLQGKSSLVT